MGQQEWWIDRFTPASAFRATHPATPIALLCDVGHGHFDHNAQLIDHLALFLRKTAEARLPALPGPSDQAVPLRSVEPRTGWLVDPWRAASPRHAPAAPFAEYTGNRADAFWAFDAEHARSIEHYNPQHGRTPQLLGFRDPDAPAGATTAFIPQTRSHHQVLLPFAPAADGLTFSVEPGFLATVPPGNPEKWSGLPAGAPLTRATGGGPIQVLALAGPVAATALPHTFRVAFHRGAEAEYPHPTQDLWLLAHHAGDATHASITQQALIRVPTRHSVGAAQLITFPAPPDQTATTATLRLAATTDAQLPVSYYVRSGPAIVVGDTLVFTPLPPRTRYPVEITVVAWQYGRTDAPAVQTARPVTRTFLLQSPSSRPSDVSLP